MSREHLAVIAAAAIAGLVALALLGPGDGEGRPTPHDSIIRQTVTAMAEATAHARGLGE